MIDDRLLGIKKPARYIGSEWNVSTKDFASSDTRFCICFPDVYEIGMSNLGIRIIYSVLNAMEGVCCERSFSPDIDMEKLMREQNVSLFSLESQKPLGEFDLVGISLGYELCYTNVLTMLDLSGIPLKSSQRTNRHPLIIGGGPCSLNPEPMSEFFDFFLIGEAEEALGEIVALYRRCRADYRSGALQKRELLKMVSSIEGVYVPSLYGQKPGEPLRPAEDGVPERVKKRVVNDLENLPFPVDWLVPYIQVVHDRITVEVTRGCSNRCRFCQARCQYYPLRQRSVETVAAIARASFARTGYEEISLTGLSMSDYPHLKELLEEIIPSFRKRGVSVSLPSVKPNAALGGLSAMIASIRKTGLTFAPEAATERLRQIIGKDFSEEDLFKTLEQAYGAGYEHVKLYFMVGLPGETPEDLDAIVSFAEQVSRLKKKVAGRSAHVNVSINTMIPKPHTPFQWMAMTGLEDMASRAELIRKRARKGNLKVSFHNRLMSYLECVFSRGDRRLGAVIETAFRKGARFDAWDEHFSFARWMECFQSCGVDPQDYCRGKPTDEALPWSFVDTGVPLEVLKKEYYDALSRST